MDIGIADERYFHCEYIMQSRMWRRTLEPDGLGDNFLLWPFFVSELLFAFLATFSNALYSNWNIHTFLFSSKVKTWLVTFYKTSQNRTKTIYLSSAPFIHQSTPSFTFIHLHPSPIIHSFIHQSWSIHSLIFSVLSVTSSFFTPTLFSIVWSMLISLFLLSHSTPADVSSLLYYSYNIHFCLPSYPTRD